MKYTILLLVVFCFVFPAYSQRQEDITITTYYPSPNGVYQSLLVTERQAIGDVNGDGRVDDNDLAHNAAGPMNGTLAIASSLGIGTVVPQGELHVRSTDDPPGNANLILEGEDPASSQPGTSVGSWDIAVSGGTAGTPPAGDLSLSSTDTAAPPNTTTPVTIEQGAPDDSLYVSDNGNVGIGTDDPQARLDVNGTVRIGNDPGLVCGDNTRGVVRYNNGQLQACTASGWAKVGGSPRCKRIRSPSYGDGTNRSDAVFYCPVGYPRLFSCTAVDGKAGTDTTEAPDLPDEEWWSTVFRTQCTTSGLCDAAGDRYDLGGETMYFETVNTLVVAGGVANVVEGCWQYDHNHVHKPYRLEILCCEN